MGSDKEIYPYDGHLAMFLAVMCHQAYQLSAGKSFILPKGYSLKCPIPSSSGEIFGFIAESEDHVVIVFRGTSTVKNVTSYLNISQVTFPFVKDCGKTHRGITRLYSASRSIILTVLMRTSPRKKLLVTGHSLGACLATLFTLDAAVNTPFNNPILYTFASLPIGNTAFVKSFYKEVKNSNRIINVNDTVTNHITPMLFRKEPLMNLPHGEEFRLKFENRSVRLNHKIVCYFNQLRQMHPGFAKQMCRENPGFCPNISKCCGEC
ncbi:lipase family protein [Fictibacillus phosphorivorans]|uniref:lipase family protein n=1 Tax=Fictibacillus phosphorivorans TaxID=1221500 RepID=UPI00203E3197|nr:lipase family protein [Fictibacillus phosphorivorans]MCM3720222.1 lipase family protein [Fictibacillus phosphorivorans]MCM3777933.1 lipase family protein [Fictibacillus phosphorivorans]